MYAVSSATRLNCGTAAFRPKLKPGSVKYATRRCSGSHCANTVYSGALDGTCR